MTVYKNVQRVLLATVLVSASCFSMNNTAMVSQQKKRSAFAWRAYAKRMIVSASLSVVTAGLAYVQYFAEIHNVDDVKREGAILGGLTGLSLMHGISFASDAYDCCAGLITHRLNSEQPLNKLCPRCCAHEES